VYVYRRITNESFIHCSCSTLSLSLSITPTSSRSLSWEYLLLTHYCTIPFLPLPPKSLLLSSPVHPPTHTTHHTPCRLGLLTAEKRGAMMLQSCVLSTHRPSPCQTPDHPTHSYWRSGVWPAEFNRSEGKGACTDWTSYASPGPTAEIVDHDHRPSTFFPHALPDFLDWWDSLLPMMQAQQLFRLANQHVSPAAAAI
jgi:hypothetical protein